MLVYSAHEKLSLKGDPRFNEAWLHERIAENPTILGLGDVRVIDRERALGAAGRLDMLLYDEDLNCRYETEIMLGATDPSHIIRTIEYWDVERRRYPAHEHVAVIIAEDITTRFLNVMSLLSGSIPLIAIQLSALRVEDRILLDFVRVLDLTALRADDSDEDAGGGQVDRAYWEQRAGPAPLAICDGALEIVRRATGRPFELNYIRPYIGLRVSGVVRNFVYFRPLRTGLLHIAVRNIDAQSWKTRLEQAGITARVRPEGKARITVSTADFEAYRDLIAELITAAAGGPPD